MKLFYHTGVDKSIKKYHRNSQTHIIVSQLIIIDTLVNTQLIHLREDVEIDSGMALFHKVNYIYFTYTLHIHFYNINTLAVTAVTASPNIIKYTHSAASTLIFRQHSMYLC